MAFSLHNVAGSFAAMRPWGRWLVLAVVSAVFVVVLERLGVPAALLLGSMLAAALAGVFDARLRVPAIGFRVTQAVVASLVASAITPDIAARFLADWPLFLGVVMATMLASMVIGWCISRAHLLPGSTGIWGSSPGGAAAMVLMAEAFGADARLVAFMQYLRVACVTLAAAVIAALWTDTATGWPRAVTGGGVFPAFAAQQWLVTGGLVLLGLVAAKIRSLPGAGFIAPMVTGAVLTSQGLAPALPPWLLAASYVVLGWSIGLGFTLAVLRIALKALPLILGSIATLMLFCGGLALLLVWTLGLDPLTAYLATSPGGLDAIAAIAAASHHVDLAFVMALQTVRFVIVVAVSPFLARLVVRLSPGVEG